MARIGLAAVAASAALLIGTSTAGAATVNNPGPFTASFTGGQLDVLGGTAIVPITPGNGVTVGGTIDPNGNIAIAAASLTFPTFHAEPIPGTTFDVQLVSDGASGTLNPSTGATVIRVRTHVVATITGLIDDTCRAGTAAQPLELPLTTGTSGGLAGTPYNPADGSLTLVNSFTLGTITCEDPDNADTAAALGAMVNELTLAGKLSPVIKPFVAQSTGGSGGTGGGGGNPPPQTTLPAPQVTTPTQEGQGTPTPPAPGCVVPKLKGLKLSKAKAALKKARCRTGKVTKKKSRKKKGTVIAHRPKAGSKLAAGTRVALTVSDGPPKKKRKKKR